MAESFTPTGRILVTGATGTLGRLLVPRLRARGLHVRVLSRQPVPPTPSGAAQDTATQAATPLEHVQGDWHDLATLQRALAGVEQVFLLTPITPTLAEEQGRIVQAAQTAGVRRIVKLSGSDWTLPPQGDTLAGQQHAAVEQQLAGSRVAATVLRPNAWMQIALQRLLQPLRAPEAAALHWPFGLARVSFIDARDIADAAVAALRQPWPAPGAPVQVQVLTGEQRVDGDDVALLASRVLGREIRSVVLPAPAAVAADADFTTQVHAQFRACITAGAASEIDPTLGQVLGRAPRSVTAFVQEQWQEPLQVLPGS